MKSLLFESIDGRTSLLSIKHSVATSIDFLDINSTKSPNSLNSLSVKSSNIEPELSKNFEARALDFHVPLYKRLPNSAQSDIFLELRFCNLDPVLDLKNDTAKPGD